MCKYLRNLASLMIVCLLLNIVFISVNAETNCDEHVVGSSSDISGYVIQDENDVVNKSRAVDISPVFFDDGSTYYLVFSITAAEVTGLLTSNVGGKMFSTTTLPDSARKVMYFGIMYHSLAEEQLLPIESGVCYYNPSNDQYVSIHSVTSTNGNWFKEVFDISLLVINRTYYSFVKNASRRGYTYGTLSLYYCN